MKMIKINRKYFLMAITAGAVSMFISVNALAAKENKGPRPNILWITTEDNSPTLGCYGDTRATTPNQDKLAAEGVMYTNAYANCAVCAPARFTLMMGVTAQKMGTVNMRSGHPVPDTFYPYVKYLNEAGYYCIFRDKGDYNYGSKAPPSRYFHESKNWYKGFWKSDQPSPEDTIDGKRKANQPFFCHINIGVCHESAQNRLSKYEPSEEELASVSIPPYLMDNAQTRKEWAKFYHSIVEADVEIGRILKKLDESGLAEDTIVFCFSDHGGPQPRGKRFINETGTRVPLMIRFPEKFRHLAPGSPGTKIDRMVSFVDFAPTLLNLVDVKIPGQMEGVPFLGPNCPAEPEYVFLARDRVDSFYDLSRAVRSKNYRYIRNYTPAKLKWQRAVYPENCYKSIAQHREDFLAGRCNEVQSVFWQSKPTEEFYDVVKDPWEINNLIDDPACEDEIKKMREVNSRHIREILDPGFIPEAELIKRCNPSFTPYDLVRREGFPYEILIQTAEKASEMNPDNLKTFIERMSHDEAAVRFWAAMGCASLGQKAESSVNELRKLLKDDSLDVRAAAAEAMTRIGKPQEGLPALIADLGSSGPEYHRVISTLTDLDCCCPGILEPYKEQLKEVKLSHWRNIKSYNFLASQYGLPQRDQAAAKKAAEKK